MENIGLSFKFTHRQNKLPKQIYNNLSEVTEKYSENIVIVMGDFNAQVGAHK